MQSYIFRKNSLVIYSHIIYSPLLFKVMQIKNKSFVQDQKEAMNKIHESFPQINNKSPYKHSQLVNS